MKYSRLLSTIMNSRWMIRPEEMVANETIVYKLLNRKYSDDKFNQILSDTNPVQYMIAASTSKSNAEASQYDNAPKESIAIFENIGTMLKYGSWCSYGALEICDAAREAISHPNIDALILDTDSGGGSVDAIPPYLDLINYAHSLGKPVIALCDLCASAAYYVASHCDEIIARNNISSEFGSIGVMMGWQSTKERDMKEGITNHVVYSTRSKWKNLPFRKAEDGGDGAYDLLQSEELDPLELKFENDVIDSRGKKLDQTVEGILSGRMFFAEDAKKYGLIDGVGNLDYAIKRAKVLKDRYLLINYSQ